MTHGQKIRMALACRLAPGFRACAELETRLGRLPTADDSRALDEILKRQQSPPTVEEIVKIAISLPLEELPNKLRAEAEQLVAEYEAAARPV